MPGKRVSSPDKSQFKRTDSKLDPDDPSSFIPTKVVSSSGHESARKWKFISFLVILGFLLVASAVSIFHNSRSNRTRPQKLTSKKWIKKDPVVTRTKLLQSKLARKGKRRHTRAHSVALVIHMMWTTSPSTFQYRNYKAIDSYLYHHPDASINIYASLLHLDHFSNYTQYGYNVRVVRLDDDFLRHLSEKCPGKTWIQQLDKWKSGKYFYSHVTDYVRFCVLYAEGGLYSDFDAITLQRLDQEANFIGRDAAMSNGTCRWCAFQNEIYLPPGVMATERYHPLAKKALEIGFEGEYNPDIFNSVGPMAITQAYMQTSNPSIKILEQVELYPYNYLTSFAVFEEMEDFKGQFERLRRLSKSLHLYGHQTSRLVVQANSILSEAFQAFSLFHDTHDNGGSLFDVRLPAFVQLAQQVEEIEDVRIKPNPKFELHQAKWNVEISCNHGQIAMLDEQFVQFDSQSIRISDKSVAQLNRKLSRLAYSGKSLPQGRDSITVKVAVRHQKERLERVTTIPVYDISSLVTVIVKTVGRIDKVIQLSESVQKLYDNLTLIVSDDDENIFRQEGKSRGFYYLPLPEDVGLSAGRNAMIEKVDTEFFLTLDDDFTMDATSRLGGLVHALDTYPTDSDKRYDIAAGKNILDENKFGIDFCGKMTISDKILYLMPGTFGSHQDCQHVDFVPNIFLGRTSVFKHDIQWDPLLKLGEHEDFFLRAKSLGIKTLTCPAITFLHDQVPHWLKRDKYEMKRSRVFDFLRLSLRKHGLEKLNSFGRIMMDLIGLLKNT